VADISLRAICAKIAKLAGMPPFAHSLKNFVISPLGHLNEFQEKPDLSDGKKL
jgi:hypothetical protein